MFVDDGRAMRTFGHLSPAIPAPPCLPRPRSLARPLPALGYANSTRRRLSPALVKTEDRAPKQRSTRVTSSSIYSSASMSMSSLAGGVPEADGRPRNAHNIVDATKNVRTSLKCILDS